MSTKQLLTNDVDVDISRKLGQILRFVPTNCGWEMGEKFGIIIHLHKARDTFIQHSSFIIYHPSYPFYRLHLLQ